MPRGDGKKSGAPRLRRARYDLGTYVPVKLRRRLVDWEESKKTFKPSEVDMLTKPGSQNPTKNGPRRNRGV